MPHRFRPAGLPLVVTVHHVVHDPGSGSFKTPLQRFYHRVWISRLESRTVGAADLLTADSLHTAARIEEVYGISTARVLPIWIDCTVATSPKNREMHSPFRLLFVGNWSRRKGVDLLPEIMNRLGPAFELRCASGLRG